LPRYISRATLVALLAFAICGCEPSISFDREQVIDQRGLFAAQFDEQGRRLIASAVAGPSGLWQTDPSAQLFRWHLGGDTNSAFDLIAISRDATVGATVSDTRLATWDATTGRNTHFVQLPKKPQSIQLSPDGRLLLVIGIRQLVAIDTRSGKIIRSFEIDQDILGAVFFSRAAFIAVYTADQVLSSYSLDSQERVESVRLPELRTTSLQTINDRVAIGHKGGLTLWPDGLGSTASHFVTDKLNRGVAISVVNRLSSGDLVATSNTGKLFRWSHNGKLKGVWKLDMPKKLGRGQARVLAIVQTGPSQLLLAGSHGQLLTLNLLSER